MIVADLAERLFQEAPLGQYDCIYVYMPAMVLYIHTYIIYIYIYYIIIVNL